MNFWYPDLGLIDGLFFMDSTRPYRASVVIRNAANDNTVPKKFIGKIFFITSFAVMSLFLLGWLLVR